MVISRVRQRFSLKTWIVLAFVALILCEQTLIKYLDYRAKWNDEAFREYLADPPTERKLSGAAFACRYRTTALIYRYRICLSFPGKEGTLLLHTVGVTGYLSLILEEGGDRETWDTTQIWFLDNDLNFIQDARR